MSIEMSYLKTIVQKPVAGRQESSPQVCKTLHTVDVGGDAPHVLFIIDELCEIGGAERVLLQTVRLLRQRNYNCSVITFKIQPNLEETQQIDFPLYVFPLGRTYNWNALRVALQIRRIIREQKVSIVHTFFETSDIWGSIVAKLSGVPVLISSRRDMGILRSRKHFMAYKFTGPLYDAVLTVAPQVRDYCINQDGIHPDRVHTLFNGLEMEKIESARSRVRMRRELQIGDHVPVIPTFANIRRIKGIDGLAPVPSAVCAKFPESLFFVIGTRSDRQYCEELDQMVASLNLQKNFRFLGSSEDVASFLKMSDVFCLLSRSEGFSNALIEAMACRLPCVATDVGGNREALQDGKSGFLVANEDWETAADRVLRLLQDSELTREMGDSGHDIVLDKFTGDVMMDNLLAVYRETLRRKAK